MAEKAASFSVTYEQVLGKAAKFCNCGLCGRVGSCKVYARSTDNANVRVCEACANSPKPVAAKK